MTATTTDTAPAATQEGQQQGQAPAGEPTTTPAPTPADLAAQQATQQGQDTSVTDADGTTWTLADAVKEIGRLRQENGKDRTNAKQAAADEARQALAQEIGKALGLVATDDAPPTPEALTAQVTEATTAREQAEADARAARVELAVFRAAADHRADAQALLDSRTFTDSLADVDPTDSEAVTNAIKTFVSKHPRFLTQAVGASSADHAGGSGEGAITPEQFKQMSGQERNELYRRDPALYARLSGRA